jgi:hypothetical protein
MHGVRLSRYGHKGDDAMNGRYPSAFRVFLGVVLAGLAYGRGTAPMKESPYETVIRLRREAAAQGPQVSADSAVQSTGAAGPVVARVELKLVPPFQGGPAGMLGLQRQDTTTVRPAGVRETPRDAPREPVYFVVRVGDKEMQGTTYRSTRRPADVVLLLDTDGDGLWSDERAYVGRRQWIFSLTATYEFGPVYLRQGRYEAGGDVFYVQCSDGKWLTLWPAFYRDGKVTLEGKTYRVTLMDTDFDGRYNESFVPPAAGSREPGCDVLTLDAGSYEDLPTGGRRSRAEIVPLSRLISVAGRYYALTVPEDGSTIEFRRAEPAFGMLDLGGKEVTLELWSDVGRQKVSGSEKLWRLPAGRYGVVSLKLTEVDAGDSWTFETGGALTGPLRDFEIRPGQTTAFKIGPPFEIKASLRRRGQEPLVDVGFTLQGQGGERYSGAPKKNGKEPPEPSLKILDGAGQVVHAAQFAYG